MTRTIVVFLPLLLAACGDEVVTCSTPQVVEAVGQNYVKQVRDRDPQNGIGAGNLKAVVSDITPIDAVGHSLNCAATLSFSYDRSEIAGRDDSAPVERPPVTRTADMDQKAHFTEDQLQAYSFIRGNYRFRYKVDVPSIGQTLFVSSQIEFDVER